MTTATVVGSGPNGLSAAIVLAQAGLDVTVVEANEVIGGGARSAELTIPGLVHDVCSAIHPTGIASPFFRSLDLARHGLEWVLPPVQAVHLVDERRAGVMHADLEETARGMGADADRWRRLYEPFTRRAEQMVDDVLGPVPHVPQHPLDFARFGLRGLPPLALTVRRWESDEAPALMASFAAHILGPMTRPTTTGVAIMFGALGQAGGWPAAKGGSQAIVAALAAELRELGDGLVTGTRVRELPDADVVMLDTSPADALRIVGDRMPHHVRRAFGRWQHGPASFKIDLAVEGGIPWSNPDARRAGTVHLGGTWRQVHEAEVAVNAGRMPDRPFILLTQQHLADPSRCVGDVVPIWAYAHVPAGYDRDVTDVILDEIERHAPGFRDRVIATAVRAPADLESENANYVGGDITGGANTLRQTVFRPRVAPDPYRIADGIYLCSSSTPPGGGVHGMSGYQAARRALRRL